MKPLKILIALSLLLLVGLQSCKKDDHGVAPNLPPESSFIPDFSDFQSDEKAIADTTKANWGYAALNVAVWNTAIFVTMAVPVASFRAAFNYQAEFQSGTTWLWEYSWDDIWGVTYTAKLYGTVNDGTVDWEMYISKQGQYEDYLWYTGVMQSDGSSVTWTLNNIPAVGNEFLSIVWNKSTDTTGNITFTNIVPNGADNGNYIKYGNDDQSDLNAYYLIYDKSEDNLVEIEWSQETQNGRVKSEKWFGDTEWHCWDENFYDTECN